MKLILISILLLQPCLSSAGGSQGGSLSIPSESFGNGQGTLSGVGGGVLESVSPTENSIDMRSNHDMVYYQGENQGMIKFSHAQFINHEWQVRSYSLSSADVKSDAVASSALVNSKITGEWVRIK